MKKEVRLRSNIAANFSGRTISALMGIIFTPVYIAFLGIEAYGLIGFYITLNGALQFLQLGMGWVCSRELARLSGQSSDSEHKMLDTLRSFEIVYWIIAVLVAMFIYLLSPWIASSWLNTQAYTHAELENVVILMACVIALRWPIGIYTGALSGLQRQIPMNILVAVIAVINWGGASLVLWLYQANIEVFFQWQLLVATLSVLLFFAVTWRNMPGEIRSGRFSWQILKDSFPLASGVAVNTLLESIITQADKIILSAIMPLKFFAYYVLASLIADALPLLTLPISNAVYPRMSQMISKRASTAELKKIFHLACQATNILVIPLGLMLAIFPSEILFIYTGDEVIAKSSSMILTFLALARTLSSNLGIAFAMQLAVGKVKMAVYSNMAALCILIPGVYFLTEKMGMEGAAIAWLIVGFGYAFVGMPLIISTYFQKEWTRWFIVDLLLPVAISASILLMLLVFIKEQPLTRLNQVVSLGFSGVLVSAIVAISFPEIRAWLNIFPRLPNKI